jgi:4-amino-4-deoxy-L-arabinose transferase-like glycosyltransferase
MPQFPAHRGLTVVLILAMALRLGWALSRSVEESSLSILPDQKEYLELGRNLLHGEGLKFVDPRFGEPVYAFRAPGYPFLVAACGGNLRVIRAAQALLDATCVLAVWLLARRWLAPTGSLIAAAIVALNPFLIYFTGLILSETLFTAMLAWGLVLLLARGGRWWIGGGALLALSILVRPGAIALPVVLGLIAALLNRDTAGPYHRRWPPAGATTLLLTAVALLPWAIRNHRVLGQWIWTSTNAGFTAYDGFNSDATGASDQDFVRLMPQLRRMTEIERNQYLQQRAGEFVRMHRGRALQLSINKAGRTWTLWPLSSQFSRPPYVIVACLFSGAFYLMVLAGLWYGTLPQLAKVLLLVPAIYFTLSAILTVGSLRYRLPAEVPMAVLAAAGVDGLQFRRRGIPSSLNPEP